MYGILTRYSKGSDNSLIGNLRIYKDETLVFGCATMENKGHKIEEGEYNCISNYSPKFRRDLYLLQDSTRQGIRIHAGNYAFELNGCIALGGLVIYTDDIHMVRHSRMTMRNFDKVTMGKPFKLTIKNNYND